MKVLLVALLAAVALASGAATGASVGATAAASTGATAGASASATSTTSAGTAAAAGATAGASARARAAAMDFSDLNSLYPGGDSASETHAAAGARHKIAGIDVSVFDEINKRAVDRALRLVDFDPDSIARISLLQTADGVDLSLHDVHEASLRGITDALRGGKRPRAVFSLGDEDSAAVRRDFHVTAFLEEAMELNKQADDRFFPTLSELQDLLSTEDVKPADAAAASAAAAAARGAPKAHAPPPPGAPAAAAAAARQARQQQQQQQQPQQPKQQPPQRASPAPSFIEHAARASVQAEARARANAALGGRAGNPTTPAGVEAAGPNPLSETANPPTDAGSGGYQAPHAPPSFHEWLQGGAPGSGQTAENLGVDYKPDPRRHPPPPPVPNPPPPPPPSSFTAFSPLASFR